MRVVTTLEGTSPLLLHNVQLADPDNRWSKAIRTITDKRKKTEDDRAEIARLEWFGSLYTDDGKIVIPATNVRRCFQEAAKISKQGRSIQRAVNAVSLNVPLQYSGPTDIEELSHIEAFRDTTVVGVGLSRTPRCRPIFYPWGVVVEWELVTNALDYDAFREIVNLAGVIEGLGDNRTGGYGRFTAKIGEIGHAAAA